MNTTRSVVCKLTGGAWTGREQRILPLSGAIQYLIWWTGRSQFQRATGGGGDGRALRGVKKGCVKGGQPEKEGAYKDKPGS